MVDGDGERRWRNLVAGRLRRHALGSVRATLVEPRASGPFFGF